MTAFIRPATPADIPGIQLVRNAVKENRLSNPDIIPDALVHEFLFERGIGWVAVIGTRIAGFAIVDFHEQNVWALFVDPVDENKGIGKKLLQVMLEYYFRQSHATLWLSTAPGTRAEKFYEMQGWKKAGMQGKEVKFTMRLHDWEAIHKEPDTSL